MNRRDILRWLGLAPVALPAAINSAGGASSFYSGGIAGQAFIGEAGPEQFLPLRAAEKMGAITVDIKCTGLDQLRADIESAASSSVRFAQSIVNDRHRLTVAKQMDADDIFEDFEVPTSTPEQTSPAATAKDFAQASLNQETPGRCMTETACPPPQTFLRGAA